MMNCSLSESFCWSFS